MHPMYSTCENSIGVLFKIKKWLWKNMINILGYNENSNNLLKAIKWIKKLTIAWHKFRISSWIRLAELMQHEIVYTKPDDSVIYDSFEHRFEFACFILHVDFVIITSHVVFVWMYIGRIGVECVCVFARI